MRCERFDKLIYLFLDGRLDQGKEKELKEHLSECERCAKKLALLESVEGRAKKIEIKEPPQEYWDSFSSRVREKILARKERSPAFGLKKALESIFSFSPLKIKLAAGLASVVLVFIIGKLYVDYRGEEILPSKAVIQTEKQPQLEIMEMEKKKGFPIEDRRKIGSIPEKPEMKREPATAVQQEGKAIPPKREGVEKEALLKEEKITTQPKVAEEKAVPVYAPTLEDQTSIETEKPLEPQVISPEAKPTGAGVEGEVEEKVAVKMAARKKKTQKADQVPQKGKAQKAVSRDIVAFSEQNLQALLTMDHYVVNKKIIPKVTENDTLVQADELRGIIQTWKAYIEENPTDSLTNLGYLQVAIGYYLLGKLSQDTAVISEGSKLIEEYLDRIKDPKVKDNLSDRLEKIKALRQR